MDIRTHVTSPLQGSRVSDSGFTKKAAHELGRIRTGVKIKGTLCNCQPERLRKHTLTHLKKLEPSYVSWITHNVVFSTEARFEGPICGLSTLNECQCGKNISMIPACASDAIEKVYNSRQNDGLFMTWGYLILWWIQRRLLMGQRSSSIIQGRSVQHRSGAANYRNY